MLVTIVLRRRCPPVLHVIDLSTATDRSLARLEPEPIAHLADSGRRASQITRNGAVRCGRTNLQRRCNPALDGLRRMDRCGQLFLDQERQVALDRVEPI